MVSLNFHLYARFPSQASSVMRVRSGSAAHATVVLFPYTSRAHYTHSYLLVILIVSYTFSRRGTHFCVYKTKYGSTFFLTSLPFLRISRGGAGVVRGSTKSLYPQLLYPAVSYATFISQLKPG